MFIVSEFVYMKCQKNWSQVGASKDSDWHGFRNLEN